MKLHTLFAGISFTDCIIAISGMPGAIEFGDGWAQCLLLLVIGVMFAYLSCELKKRRTR